MDEAVFLRSIDLHIHTNNSDGKSSVTEVYNTAKTRNLRFVAITDHYSESVRFPKRMSRRDLRGYLDSLRGFDVYKGLEVEILDDGSVSMSPKIKERVDFAAGGLHRLRGVRFWGDLTPILDDEGFVEGMRLAFIKAMETRLLDVVAHVTGLPEAIRSRRDELIDSDWVDSVVEAASDFNVAFELNGLWKVPEEDFVKRCLRKGVKLCLGSDSHTLQRIGDVGYGVRVLKRLKVPRELIYLPFARTI